MAEIDIDGLSEDELVALNVRIVERLRFLHQQKTTSALQDIKIGTGVIFEGPGGEIIRGIVIRRNRKTVTVHTDNDRRWNVSPGVPQAFRRGYRYPRRARDAVFEAERQRIQRLHCR